MKRLLLCALWLLLSIPTAQAQGLDIGLVTGNEAAQPIAVLPMQYLGRNASPDTDVAKVIRDDLNRSGQFKALALENMPPPLPTRGNEIDFAAWRLRKQDFIVVGRLVDGADGSYQVEYDLYDVAKRQRLLGLPVAARSKALRDASHQIADEIYEKILGVRGPFWTRIAYVKADGLGQGTRYKLVVADSDGYNEQVVVRSPEPLLSPAWSPDGRKLAYVSFERGNSTIYVQDLTTGGREVVASFKGINGAPAFSPDGRRLALTLSKGGNPDIYVMDLATKSLNQVTRHYGIDTEATWMPDGKTLVFTSDRAGKPQVYTVPASGGDPTRISFQGESNARPTVSYDGKKIAMAQGSGNIYRIAIQDRSYGGGARWLTVSPGNLDESPSFAPNAGLLLYATKEGRRGVLYAVSADGRVRQRVSSAENGDVREPAWGPFRQR